MGFIYRPKQANLENRPNDRPNRLGDLTINVYNQTTMDNKQSAKREPIEAPTRIEPARVEEPTEAIIDAVAELSATSAILGKALHPHTAANLTDIVRIMNTYYSNLIEGHNTRPKDIERALAGSFDDDEQRRNLQIEAAAHVRVQAEVDRMAAEN